MERKSKTITTIEQQLPHHHHNLNSQQLQHQNNNNNHHLNISHHHQHHTTHNHHQQQQQQHNSQLNNQQILQLPPSPTISIGCCSIKRNPPRPPQEIYFESRGKCCKKLLRYNGYPNKILLYPEEGWARSAASSYWTITPCRWRRNTCIVEEVAGTRKTSTHGRMISAGTGSLLIMGTFKRRLPDPDFKLYLTSNITLADYNMGYCLTGTLERGCQKSNNFQTTHFAVIRRCWPSNEETNKS